MSDVKWTEGEWRVVERLTNGVGGWELCWSDEGEAVTDHVYQESDAHLMAASKNLYEALERSTEYMRESAIKTGPLHSFWDQIFANEDILAKARGEHGIRD